MIEQLFDALKAEKGEGDILIDQGIAFEVPKRSLLRFFSKKPRKFMIYQPYLGTLDILSRLQLDIRLDEQLLSDNPLSESRRVSAEAARICAEIVAVAVLNSKWGIKLFKGFLVEYFMWRVTPRELLNLAIIVTRISNLTDFIHSIRLMSANRTTTPRLIENQDEQAA